MCVVDEAPGVGERRLVRPVHPNFRRWPGKKINPGDVLFIEEWDGTKWCRLGETTGAEALARRNQDDQ